MTGQTRYSIRTEQKKENTFMYVRSSLVLFTDNYSCRVDYWFSKNIDFK